jgi:hypothetical protein
VWDESVAWLTVAFFVITYGYYGADRIFSYCENYLTARSIAEVLVVAAVGCHVHGRRRLGACIAAGAMFIHPLMALPGLMLLAYLWMPARLAVFAAAGVSGAALLVSLAAAISPWRLPALAVMDPAWLEVVRERSQFLFLKYWSSTDWEIALRPFVCLTLAALVTSREEVRKLCIAAMLVGASGLAVAWTASTVGPVALLLQGQAWRWTWITAFVSVLLLAPTVRSAWQDPRGGPLCCILLLAGWTYTEVDVLACTEGALFLWLARERFSANTRRLFQWAAWALAAIIVATVLAHAHRAAVTPVAQTGREPQFMGRIREMFGLGATSLLVLLPCWIWLRRDRRPLIQGAVAAGFLAAALSVLPGSIRQLHAAGTPAQVEEFADWRAAIPDRANVLIVPATRSAAFAWFTLQRPSYLTLDQSAGVVFSPITAQEVRRRSEVLLPLWEPDWRLYTQIQQIRAGLRRTDQAPVKLTGPALEKICRDPQLGFVIAPENVGFNALPHHHPGNFNNWNLYDCRAVRGGAPAA